jgi:ABC-type Fe3+ transport system substrate-binding protein
LACVSWRASVPDNIRKDCDVKKKVFGVLAACVVGWSSVVIGTAATASASGGVPTTLAGVLKQIQGMNASQRQSTLINDAKAEGDVLYISTQQLKAVYSAQDPVFTQETGIKVYETVAGTNQIISTLAQQVGAGQVQTDLLYATDQFMYEAAGENLIQKYSMPWINYPKQFKFPRWYDSGSSGIQPTWNTSVIPASKAPKTLLDVLKNYPGLIGFASNQAQWFAAVSQWLIKTQHMTQSQINSLFENAVQHGRVYSQGIALEQALDSGSIGITPSDYTASANASIAAGAPVSYTPVIGPVVTIQAGIGLITNLPHPAAALLYADFDATKGQTIAYQVSKQGSTYPPAAPTTSQIMNIPQSELDPVSTSIYKDINTKWQPLWNQVLGLPA